jgi:hypothetical protein
MQKIVLKIMNQLLFKEQKLYLSDLHLRETMS